MLCTHIWFAEQNVALGNVVVPTMSFHENLGNFPWKAITGEVTSAVESRRIIVDPKIIGIPSRRERSLGMMAGHGSSWCGLHDHQSEFEGLFSKQLCADASIFMVDTQQSVQEQQMFHCVLYVDLVF